MIELPYIYGFFMPIKTIIGLAYLSLWWVVLGTFSEVAVPRDGSSNLVQSTAQRFEPMAGGYSVFSRKTTMHLSSHPFCTTVLAVKATGLQKSSFPIAITAEQCNPFLHSIFNVLLYFCTHLTLSISFNDTPPLADSLNNSHCLSKLFTLEVLS